MKQVLFWSKYSSHSKKLITLMNQYNAHIEKVCVDNSDIRNRILNDKRITISVVPTILAVYTNGIIEKYEGEKAFELLYTAFQKEVVPTHLETQSTSPSPSCEGMYDEIKKDLKEPKDKVKSDKVKSDKVKSKKIVEKSPILSSLEDLTGDDLFTTDDNNTKEYILEDEDENETGRGDASTSNLPIKADSKISSRAAAIAQSRDAMDANTPRPMENNINPI